MSDGILGCFKPPCSASPFISADSLFRALKKANLCEQPVFCSETDVVSCRKLREASEV